MGAVFNPHSNKLVLLPMARRKTIMLAIKRTELHVRDLEENPSNPLRAVYRGGTESGTYMDYLEHERKDILQTLRECL
jgi:hypothetical protein